jgi:hypothetical protein
LAEQDTSPSTIQCANPACTAGSTGKCLEGLALEACPYYGKTTKTEESHEGEVDRAERSRPLSSGERLDIAEANSTLRHEISRVVTIVGMVGAGKTSLIASVYDLFQTGSVDGIGFAGSKTLVAFERACHHARLVAGRFSPEEMPRTTLSEPAFFHIKVRPEAREAISILVSDRAGEYYRLAADDPTSATKLIELARADIVTVLVDGGRLLDNGDRHNVKSETELMLQGLIDGDVFKPNLSVALVLTKLDEVKVSKDRERAEADFDELYARLKRLFGKNFSKISSFQIAASPRHENLARGHGVPALLRFWVDTVPPAVSMPLLALDSSSRAFARLQVSG